MPEEEQELPSVKKREVELGRGVILLPPERISSERPERKEQAAAPQRPAAQEAVRTSSGSNLIAILAIFIAIIAAVLASFSMYNLSKMKTELRAVVDDLKAYQSTDISVATKFGGVTHSVQASLPIKEIISPFTIPIQPQELQGKGKIEVWIPGYPSSTVIPWEGNITVTGDVKFNTNLLSDQRTMSLSYDLPGEGQLTIGIKGKDLWTAQLDDVLRRLEAMTQ